MKALIIIILAGSCISAFSQYRDPPKMDICQYNFQDLEEIRQKRAVHSAILMTAVFAAAEYYLRTENADNYTITTHYVFPAAAAVSVVYIFGEDIKIWRRKRR